MPLLISEGKITIFFVPLRKRGGMQMYVTYSELFQFCMVLIGVITLVYSITKKK